MKFLKHHRNWLIGVMLVGAVLLGVVWSAVPGALAQEGDVGTSALGVPSNSSPIAFGANVVWVVNPDDSSVSLIDANTDTLVNKIFVGDEPRSIALDNNFNAYVANAAGDSVTIIQFNGSANNAAAVATLTTGAEPWSIVARPDGLFVYVANSAQDTISIINTTTRTIVGTFDLASSSCNAGDPNRHFQPRGLAITGNGGFLFVARFLSFTGAGGGQAVDSGKEGIVCRLTINAGTGALTNPTSTSLPAQDSGFAATINNANTPTSAYPNQLQSIVICDSDAANGPANERAYLPNVAASPAGPLKFNVDTQAFVNTLTNLAAVPTSQGALNLHLGAREPEAGKTKLFFANPWAMVCNNPLNPNTAYVVSAGSDLLVKLNVSASGVLSFSGACPTCDANTARYIDLNDPNNAATGGANAGKNPLGIVINNLGSKAYVMNYISRNVSVIDLATDSVITVIQTTPLPPAGSDAEELHVGAEMFFASRGVFDGGKVDRLSSEGWQNCASCHPDGLTDGVIWRFGAGPRKSVPLNGTWSPHNPDDQRILNYSAIFDELQDFELNIRNVSGPGGLDPNHGLLIGDDGNIDNAPAAINGFALPNAGRPQLAVTLPGSNTAWPALDALKEWVRFAIRTPNGALTDAELPGSNVSQAQVIAGRRLFFQAGCQKCHGGTKWTISNKDFTSPPNPADIFTEAGAPAPPPVSGAQFLDRFLSNIGSFNLNVAGAGNVIPGQPQVGGTEKADTPNVADNDLVNARNGLGIDHNGDGRGIGFNIPSLLGIWTVQPYYHNGACETLNCVLANVTHRTAGLRPGQIDPLVGAGSQANVVAFLKTLDAETDFPLNLYLNRHDIFVDPPVPVTGSQVQLGANVSLFGTIPDLTNIIADLGLAGTLKVRFSGDGSFSPAEIILSDTDFNQDFGQAVVSTTWTVPNNAGLAEVIVEVDSDEVLPENNENDNTATRRIRIISPPPDRTPPVVNNIILSDDNPFNDNDQIATTRDIQVKIVAEDPTSPAPQETSGLRSFCIVRYAYNTALRRWVEETCRFRRLPDPEPGTTNTFIVSTQLRPVEGVAYAFVWVKDQAGNISREPGFDFISFIPGGAIRVNRNDTRLFRITTASPLQFTFTPEFGDIDVSVFQGLQPNAVRCVVSANNGLQAEVVTIGSGACSGQEFQIEVRAVVNSRFTIAVAAARGVDTATSGDISTQALPLKPLVGGPPALRTAIDPDDDETFLPIITK